MLAKSYQNNMVLFVVSLALFMEAVDTTVINTAIPSMAHAFDVNPIDLKIALICYLISLAIFIPISGWIADKYGIKRVFMAAIAIFTLSSLWCGFSHTLIELVIARILQGLGGSMMLPVGRLIIARTFTRQQLIVNMSRVVMVGSIGMMVGPVCGGLITHYFSWSWIFWINIPVGLFNFIIAYFWLIETPPQAVPRLDKIGFVLFGCGLAGLVFGFSALSETPAYHSLGWLVIVISILLLSFYIWHSAHIKNPIVNTELFYLRTFRVSAIANLLSRIGFGGITFLLPLLLQVVFGYSPQLSGFLLAPTALGVLLVKPFSLYFLQLFGYKKLLLLNTLLVSLSLWAFTLVNFNTSVYFIPFLTFAFGFLISLQYSGMNSLAYADLSPQNLSAATSVMSTLQQVSQSFGVAASAFFIAYFSTGLSKSAVLTASAFHYTFFMMGVITLLCVLVFMRLKAHDGLQMIQTDERIKIKPL